MIGFSKQAQTSLKFVNSSSRKSAENQSAGFLCVPEDSPFNSVQDLEGKRIATEAVGFNQAVSQKTQRQCRSRILMGARRKSNHHA